MPGNGEGIVGSPEESHPELYALRRGAGSTRDVRRWMLTLGVK
jgi:hypothetical protein